MSWINCIVILVMVTTSYSITKPVYKIALTQKGYAQFLQYDVETPPLREFTFCTWVRFFDLDNDQTIFTYVANGSRVVRLWLDTGGHYIKISIDENVLSSVSVDIGRDSWRHVCLSYQSDHGAWAMYIDARLVSCEAAQSLHGRVLPGGGSVIVGYGITTNGIPNGLEGEIYGVNMFLSSTIERNYTIRSHPRFKQKPFHKNKIIGSNNVEYVVLNDMISEKLQNEDKIVQQTPISNSSKSFIKFKTPYSLVEHDVGLPWSPIKTTGLADMSIEKDFLDVSSTVSMQPTDDNKINFWNIINEAGNIGKFKNNLNAEISSSGTQSLPTISEYETPPALASTHDYSDKSPFAKNPISFFDIKTNHVPDMNQNTNKPLIVSTIETPPPPSKDTKVYGQWTSSQFANSVLNYLKNNNFNQREQKKVPKTIPLLKLSDTFPYASNVKVSKIRPNLKFHKGSFMDKRLDIKKRDTKIPQINVQILQDDLRDKILESHAQTRPKDVKVTSRGQSFKNQEHRFYRNAEIQQSTEEFDSDEIKKPKPFTVGLDLKKKKNFNNSYKSNKLITILPFLKSLEYYIDNLQANKKSKVLHRNEMYSKSLSNANKWHNVKSYSNDYTPRQINMNNPVQNDIQQKIAEANKKLPSIRLKYKPDSQKLETVEEARIIQGRNLASQVSNTSNHKVDSVSLIKYNHGFLPSHETKVKSSGTVNHILKRIKSSNSNRNANSFNKHVKLGNALNERTVIGHNEEQNKHSFVGGDETVPDINRYRSDIDRETGNAPSSLGPRICKNVELYDRLLYVQPDGSIDVTHILSPVRERNIAIEFILENYKKCSVENGILEKSPLLFIDWNRTPVRLFGGAYPKKTTDLCGFF